jgi:PAS domain S-box-containing protein
MPSESNQTARSLSNDAASLGSEDLFRQFGEASPDVLWIRDVVSQRWEYLSRAFDEVFGASRDQALAGHETFGWSELIVREDREAVLTRIADVREGKGTIYEFRIRRPADGAIRWIRASDFPMRDAQGNIRRIGGIGRDITGHRSEGSYDRLLLADLQHRVRNTLAKVRSIIRRSAETSKNMEDFAIHLEGRIDAFARVQAAMIRDPVAGFDLHELISENLCACAAREGEQFSMDGPLVRLKPKVAEVLGLTLHELATNAVKYGAFTRERGHIRVSWGLQRRDGRDWLMLDWKETGMRGEPAQPSHEGFGAMVLEQTLPYDLDARVSRMFEADGFRCTIEFPMV